MIPFDRLGWFFNLFSSSTYPKKAVERLCEALLDIDEGSAVLDLGAGTGVMSRYGHGCRGDLRYVAADPSQGMLAYVPEHFYTVKARAEALPFEQNSFAAVLIGEALHHFDDPRKALEEIVRVLEPSGILFIYDFDPSTILGFFVCLAEKVLGEPANFYPPDSLRSLLESHGFAVTVLRHGWRYTLSARLQNTMDAHISTAF